MMCVVICVQLLFNDPVQGSSSVPTGDVVGKSILKPNVALLICTGCIKARVTQAKSGEDPFQPSQWWNPV